MPITTRIGGLSSRGFGQFASAVPSTPRVAYIGNYGDTVDALTYNFPSVNIGSAAIDRLVVLTVGAQASGFIITMSATIAGQAATRVVGAARTTANAIFTLPISTGTTTSVTITPSSGSGTPTFSNIRVGVFALYGLSSYSAVASVDAQNPAAGIATATILTASSGFLIMCANNSTGLSGSITLTGVTRRYNVFAERTRAGGDASNTTSGSLAISAQYSVSPTGAVTLAAASFK